MRILLFAILALGFSALAWAQEISKEKTANVEPYTIATGIEFTTRVRAITGSATSTGRMAAVAKMIDDLKVEYRVDAFEFNERKGNNLVVALGPKADKTILLGAHFDQVGVGQGAVDNACSCALLVEMIQQFQSKPLEHHALEFVFFDLEEVGLIGSKAYVAAHKNKAQLKHFVNFDIFGYGDSLWIMAAEKSDAMERAIVKSGKDAKLSIVVSDAKEYPPSDHLSFVEGGISTIAVALIDQSEIPRVQTLLRGERIALPPILQTIHSPDDNMSKIDANEVAHAIPAVERAIRLLDAS